MTRARNSANLASHGNLFVDIANDRTGIGSVAPGQSLHVAGTAGFHADVTFTGDLYNTTWDRSDNSLKFTDNSRLKLGSSQDLELYHNGTNSHIRNNTGALILNGSEIYLMSHQGTAETYLSAVANGAASLYYDNVKKFETTAYGTNTTGTAVNDGLVVAGVATVTTMNVTGVLTYDDVTSVDSVGIVTARQGVRVTADGSDSSNYISVGAGGDLKLYHESNLSFIKNITGKLVLRSDTFQFGSSDGTHRYIDIPTDEQGVDLYYDDTLRLRTGSSHVDQYGILNSYGTGNGEIRIHPAANHVYTSVKFYTNAGASNASILCHGGSTIFLNTTSQIISVVSGTEISELTSTGFNPRTSSTAAALGTSSKRWDNVYADAADIAGNVTITDSIIHSGDTNTKIRFPAADTFTVETGGSERLRITSGGQVNIGSNLTQTTYVCEVAGAYNKHGMRIVSGAPNYQDPFVVASSTGGERFRIKGDGQIYVGSDNTNFSDVGTFFNLRNNTYGGRIGFSNNTATAGVTLMEQFSYWGTNKVAGFIALAGTDTSNKDDGLLAFYTKPSGGTIAQRLRIQSDGTSIFDVGAPNSSNKVICRFQSDTSRRFDIVWHDSGSLMGFNTPDNHSYIFKCNNNEKLRITSASAIGIAGANYGTSGQVLTSGGSGSAVSWTTITGTTINNNANNRLITGSGTANTLEGESNLTFDGSTIDIAAGSSDKKIQISGTSPYIQFREGTTNKASLQWHSDGFFRLNNEEDGSQLRIQDDIKFSLNGSLFYKVWHGGNDGAGSGLDADTLDGVQGGSYLRSDTDDTVTHRTSFQNCATDNQDTIATSSSSQGGIEIYNVGQGNDAFMAFHTGSDFACYFGLDGDSNDLSVGGWSMGANKYRVWHSGNVTSLDGSGSGLDADLLDGLHAGSFLRSDADDTVSNYQHKIQYYSNSAIPTSSGSQTSLEVYSANGAGTDAFMAFHVSGDFACYLGLDGGLNDLAVGGWSMGANSHKVWHAGNDGSGSGLDADTLDGTQKSGFVLNNTNNSYMLRFGSGGNSGYAADSQAYGIFQEAGAWNSGGGGAGFPDLRINYHTGIVLAAHENYGGVRFQRDYNDTTELFSVGNADDHVRVAYNLYVGDALTIDDAFTLNQSNNNRNMKFRAGGGGDMGISGYDSGNNWCFQLYGTSNGYYGFLNANWGSWDIKKQVNGDMHLRISGSDYKVLTTKDFPSKGTNISATGGSTSTYDNHKIHDFTSNGTFEITAGAGEVEVLIVAGGGSEGGGGSGCHGGGGGGGGGVVNRFVTLGIGKYSIVIGGGGGHRNNGGNSTAFGFTALGGGAGGPTLSGNGNSGGSGGGGSRHDNNNMGGSATQPGSASGGLGNAGGRTGPSNTSPGGGGGAGGAGANGNSGGAGGPGKQFTQFNTNIYFGAGGSSGGNANGAANTGQGGGGSPGGGPRYSGGSGRVMIRYPV